MHIAYRITAYCITVYDITVYGTGAAIRRDAAPGIQRHTGTVRDGQRPAYSITAAQPPLRTMSMRTTVEASTLRTCFL